MSGLERERHKNLGLERARDSWYQAWFLATERIAVLEAERERLQCCGNCDNWSYAHRHAGEYMLCSYDAEDRSREPSEPCGFAPSRWTEREA